jgi:hypothetical protein
VSAPHKVEIDGVAYVRREPTEEATLRLLAEVYGALWTEAHYDPANESTRRFAEPLAAKMREANKTLRFKA